MTLLVKDIIKTLDTEAPFGLAEEWDNVGLLVGNPEQEVHTILIGLDPTTGLLEEAIARNADTLITHHPVIFKPLSRIDTSQPEGKLLQLAMNHNISLIACHTNLDSATAGVSDILADKLGITGLQPLVPSPSGNPTEGLGRIGNIEPPLNADVFLNRIMEQLDLPVLQVAGPVPETIGTVAVCGGSGSDLASAARKLGADIYITAEIKHNIARWAEEHRFCIVDGTHYATERPAVALLAAKLARIFDKGTAAVNILQSESEKHPFQYFQQTDHRS